MKKINRIVIVGGGTSGWMAAAALSNKLSVDQFEIRLIESSRIGTIGVGEGSTPYLKHFMHSLGFQESDWMSRCDASYKNGIYFDNWNGDKNRYFHPFYFSLDVKPAEVFFNCASARRRGIGPHINGDNFFISGHLAQQHLSPIADKTLPAQAEYGYHFDAAKLAGVLSDLSCSRGVKHISADVIDVNQDDGGDVISLVLDDGSEIQGDHFIDASGFNALLIGKTLQVPFEPFGDELLNDAAVTVSTPRETREKLATYTQSKAMSAGWMWRIPLTSRTGNGYVYSSQYLSKEQAEDELAAELNLDASTVNFRHINMKVGMRSKPWSRNVVAIGLSHGFIEPLEATALMITQWSIEYFIQLLMEVETPNEQCRDKFNTEMTRLMLGVKEYVHGHYVTSKRRDSDYWRKATSEESISLRLSALLAKWKSGEDFDEFLHCNERDMAYFRPSWYALLAGMDYRDDTLVMVHQMLDSNLIEQAQFYSKTVAEKYFNEVS